MDEKKLRKDIVNYALNEFIAKGIKSVKMDDIAKGVSMSKRTLYLIFPTKESLLMSCIETARKKQHEDLKNIDKESDGDVIKIIVGVLNMQLQKFSRINPIFYEDIQKYPAIIKKLKSEDKNHEKRILAFFKRGVEQGVFQKDLNYKIVVEHMRMQSQGFMMNKMYLRYKMVDIIKSMSMVILRGLLTEKGLQIYKANS